MTRLHHLITAQTQYTIHSPFLFEMYRQVLVARIPKAIRRQHGIARGDHYNALVYKCSHFYHLTPVPTAPSSLEQTLLVAPNLSILIVRHPHACKAAEQEWQHMQDDPRYQVSLDLYHTGLLIHNPHLHPQHFTLR